MCVCTLTGIPWASCRFFSFCWNGIFPRKKETEMPQCPLLFWEIEKVVSEEAFPSTDGKLVSKFNMKMMTIRDVNYAAAAAAITHGAPTGAAAARAGDEEIVNKVSAVICSICRK